MAPSPLGSGIQAAGQGVANVGSSMVGIAAHQKAIQEQTKKLDDMQWVDENYASYSRSLSDFTNNPENTSQSDFEMRTWNQAKDLRTELMENAPSAEAARAFESQATSQAVRRYESASAIAARNRVSGVLTQVSERAQAALHSYRTDSNRPAAVSNLYGEREQIINNAKEAFGDIAPETVNKITTELDDEMVMALYTEFPEQAKALLDSNKTIDGRRRKTLEDMIARSAKVPNLLVTDAFNKQRQQLTFDAQQGSAFNKTPVELYQAIYGEERGIINKQEDDRRIDGFSKAHEFLGEVGHMNAESQMARLQELLKDANTPEKWEMFSQMILPTITKNLELQDRDRVSWLTQSNPEVQRLQAELEAASPEQKLGVQREMYDSILRYQGYAPPDAENPEMYLNRATTDRHIMSLAQARQVAMNINNGSPGEALQNIAAVIEEFPSVDQGVVAFNDLVTMGGLEQEYQVAWLNKDEWWIDQYVGALQNTKSVESLSDVQKTELTDMIQANGTWGQFQGSVLAGNFQRADEVEGFRSAIMMMANAHTLRGKTLREAVDMAVKNLIGTNLAFTESNDRPMMIMRKAKDGTIRTEEDIEFIGEALSMVIRSTRTFPIDQLSAQNFSQYEILGRGSDQWNNQVMHDIREKGFWVSSNDGQSVTLYIENATGDITELTDNNGKAFSVDFDELLSSEHGIRPPGVQTIGQMLQAPSMLSPFNRRQPDGINAPPPWLGRK